jgi:hypothetical protein
LRKKCRNFPGYEVSETGEIFSRRGKLTGAKDRNGYIRICLRKDGKNCHEYAHRLVAKAFIENPQNKPHINHKNGVKDDNRVENLEWCTSSENQRHRYSVLKKYGVKKLTPNQVFCIRSLLSVGVPQRKLAKLFGTSQSNVSLINLKETWGSL